MKILKTKDNKASNASVSKQVIKSVNKPLRIRREIKVEDLVPSPSTTFNLECSGHVEGAFLKGTTVNIIGDSHAGKTLFCFATLAECNMTKSFDKHRFIFDDVEIANEFDLGYLFGQDFEERIEVDSFSRTIESLSDNIATALKGKEPFIYIVDSADALTSEAADKLAAENQKKRDKGNEVGGSYGDGKARAFSDLFKRHNQTLGKHGSNLIIISQTRDNLGFGAQFNPKVRSCGKALKFYSFHEVWLAMQKKEKKGDRTYLTNVQAKISKNKLTGRHGCAYFPILFDYGIDNITSCITFLVDEKFWSAVPKKGIDTKGFYPGNDPISFNQLVKYIEENELEHKLALACKACYDNIIVSMTPKRKFKYTKR